MAKKMTVDDARAQFANATQTYWVCPITQERFPADDRVAIEKHQARVLAQMESKERSKQKAARIKELQKEFAAAESLDAVRAWALRKIQLEIATFSVESLPGMAVYTPAKVLPTVRDVYIRVQGGKALTPAVKQALGLVQGKTMGIGTGTTWLLAVRASSPLGRKIQQWHLQPKKLGKEAKEHLLASNEEYRARMEKLKELSATIHALREETRALVAQQEAVREHVRGAVPDDLR